MQGKILVGMRLAKWILLISMLMAWRECVNEQSSLVTDVIITSPLAVLEILSCAWHDPKHFTFLISHMSSVIHYPIYELIFNYHKIFCITFKVNSMSSSIVFLFNISLKAAAAFLQCILNKPLWVSHIISDMTFSHMFISTGCKMPSRVWWKATALQIPSQLRST